MTAIAGIALGIGLFCWWLSGNWYAWAVAFAALAGAGWMLFVTEANGTLKGLVFAVAAWALTGIPYWFRKRRARVTIISPSSAHWPRSPD